MQFVEVEEIELWKYFWEEKWGTEHPVFLGGRFSSRWQRWTTKKVSEFDECRPISIHILTYALQVQFGIVNLHDDSIENADFNSVVLSRPELKEFLKKYNLGWWVGQVRSFFAAFIF